MGDRNDGNIYGNRMIIYICVCVNNEKTIIMEY